MAAQVAFRAAFLAIVLVSLLDSSQAQTLTVLHNFTGQADGANPYAGLTLDARGNLYGTTANGGNGGGVVFKLTRTNGSWTFAPLYKFAAHDDAAVPYAGVAFGADGSLYGTTAGGGAHDSGAVFNLRPPAHFTPNIFAPWNETVLYSFQGGADGANPYAGVIFDQMGNIFGTTNVGGSGRVGTVFELQHSGGGWTESVIYNFSGANGKFPLSDVIFDNAGNLYGTTQQGGANDFGTIYELTDSGGAWTESFLHSFGSQGESFPTAGLTFGASGHLFGATASGSGGIFKLDPLNGSWIYSFLYGSGGGIAECGARGDLVADAIGNLYGATTCDGSHGAGSIFKLTHINGGWAFITLYEFTGGADGLFPEAGVALDASGNLYGTTTVGGAYGNGVVWQLTL